ncbi:hypothetical protein K431DRAFT_283896 [Polychaeton citri CBS 116435]|uniref:Uncharacterized protein n=1 Tax=Polychaeton citri CBS 116435 TaxID=1314669 RepID=A0A9P4QD47_9PEZI|nr:hypothetical protein K431DRAFT_283896 [Polychaeton citri CBS 116435]
MLYYLISTLTGANGPDFSSVVLILGKAAATDYTLHIVPEDSAVERVTYMKPRADTFCYGASKERSHEQLGTVHL